MIRYEGACAEVGRTSEVVCIFYGWVYVNASVKCTVQKDNHALGIVYP